MEQKVVCFSLWGDDPKYTMGALRNAVLAKEIYLGWSCRFYVGTSVPEDICGQLQSLGAQLRRMDVPGDWTGTFWRFTAVADPDVDVMICRDTDSRLSLREKAAVDQWLASGKLVHIMRDHPGHRSRMLGGMWGARKPILQDIQQLIDDYLKADCWDIDQKFLRAIVFPMILDTMCVHDEFFDRRPFPTPRQGLEFVGQVYDQNDRPAMEYAESLKAALLAGQGMPDHG